MARPGSLNQEVVPDTSNRLVSFNKARGLEKTGTRHLILQLISFFFLLVGLGLVIWGFEPYFYGYFSNWHDPRSISLVHTPRKRFLPFFFWFLAGVAFVFSFLFGQAARAPRNKLLRGDPNFKFNVLNYVNYPSIVSLRELLAYSENTLVSSDGRALSKYPSKEEPNVVELNPRLDVDDDRKHEIEFKNGWAYREDVGHSAFRKTFFFTFVGDDTASGKTELAAMVRFLIEVAKPEDEIVLLINSPGGSVSPYGLCASHLQRLIDHNLNLTVCVDIVAASGGYLLASVGRKIVCAPYALIGSLGVAATVPNFRNILNMVGVDVHQLTTGKYKRSLDNLSEVRPEDLEKTQEDLNLIHAMFTHHVDVQRAGRLTRPVSELMTGETWMGFQALERGLIDEIGTSEEYLSRKMKTSLVIEIEYSGTRSLLSRFLPSSLADRLASFRSSCLSIFGF